MRSFYLEYKDLPELLQLALQIPWGQNLLIISKVSAEEERQYYLEATIKLAWSRAVLLNQIKANAYAHHIANNKLHNFKKALPVHLSEQATEALKSEYNLDFLGITEPVSERELENRLIENVRDLLMELGFGFCFIGNQYRIKLSEKEELKNTEDKGSERININYKTYKRDNKTIALIKILRNFECQICGLSIKKKDGSKYVEAAHIIPKHKKGSERPSNIILLCPNHHKEFDLGNCEIEEHTINQIKFIMNGKKYNISLSIE